MTIARVMTGRDHHIIRCGSDDAVETGARLLAEHRIGALPVMDGETVAGIFSERDLLYCVAREGARALELRIADVMTAPAITVEADTKVLDALSLMTQRRIRHLPVTQNGRMVGFVSIGDLVKYRIEAIENEAQAMRQYIATA